MGLDSIEILMKVEETFSIKITDREAQQIITVGDFHSAVWRHVTDKHSEKCQSQRLFYKLRTSFAETFDVSSKSLSVDSDCILGEGLGYAMGSNAEQAVDDKSFLPADLHVNGLEIVLQRQVFHTGQSGIETLECPPVKKIYRQKTGNFFLNGIPVKAII